MGTGRGPTSTPSLARITTLLVALAALVLAGLPAQAVKARATRGS
jgi:hypothetical protein